MAEIHWTTEDRQMLSGLKIAQPPAEPAPVPPKPSPERMALETARLEAALAILVGIEIATLALLAWLWMHHHG